MRRLTMIRLILNILKTVIFYQLIGQMFYLSILGIESFINWQLYNVHFADMRMAIIVFLFIGVIIAIRNEYLYRDAIRKEIKESREYERPETNNQF